LIDTRRLSYETQGDGQVIDLTDDLAGELASSEVSGGVVTIFVTGTTAGVTIIEHEPGLVGDMKTFMERVAPRDVAYQHNVLNSDDNGHSHTRAMLMGPSLVVPLAEGRPILGTWQRVVLVDFDSRARVREVVLQIMGE
jgi:secondary thiamine-phosphate synthase enzyme